MANNGPANAERLTQDSENMLRSAESRFRIIPRLRKEQDDAFRQLWKRNIPMVVYGVDQKLQGCWTPQDFTQSHGAEYVTMIDSHLERPTKVTVKEFFEAFNDIDGSDGRVVKVKVSIYTYVRIVSNGLKGLAPVIFFRQGVPRTIQSLCRRRSAALVYPTRWLLQRLRALPGFTPSGSCATGGFRSYSSSYPRDVL